MFRLLFSIVSVICLATSSVYASLDNNNNNINVPVHNSNYVEQSDHDVVEQQNKWVRPDDRTDWVALLNYCQYDKENPQGTKPLNVWSFDGGGILGILAAHGYAVADQVAIKLKGRSIHDFIDVYAGTSTGGIFAAAATLPGINGQAKLSSIDLFRLYRYYGSFIFKKFVFNEVNLGGIAGVKYNHEYLEKLLQHYCKTADKQQYKFSQCSRPTFVTTFSMTTNEGILFNSTDLDQIRGLPVWEVTRSTSAAPTFFNPKKLTIFGNEHGCIDGGVWANDPSAVTLNSITEEYKKLFLGKKLNKEALCVIRLVSFGAGFVKIKATAESLKDAGALKVLDPLIMSLFNANEKSVEISNQSEVSHSSPQMKHNNYGVVLKEYDRFQIELAQEIKALDNINPKALENLVERSEDQCRGMQYKSMLARVLECSIDDVENVIEEAIKNVAEKSATVNLEANDYYDHLAWIHEYILLNQHDKNFQGNTKKYKKYLEQKLNLDVLELEEIKFAELKKRVVWLSYFIIHNLEHNYDKTWWSNLKEYCFDGVHLQAEEDALDIFRELLPHFFNKLGLNEDSSINEIFKNLGDALKLVFKQNYRDKYKIQVEKSLEFTDSIPAQYQKKYLDMLVDVVKHSESKKAKASHVIKYVKGSWHESILKLIDEKKDKLLQLK